MAVQELQQHDPREVGPYRLLGLLGGGGMGQVYLAVGAGGPVALKLVHPWLATDEQFRTRFAREVAAGRRVRSPWTAQVVAADADARVPWLATEYVHGVPLDRAVRAAGPLPATSVHVLAADLARALAAIHGAGLAHRDVKPANVLLTVDRPHLIDFGIARALDATQLTGTGAAIGTPAFMSPEQADGLDTGTASDLFSLAAVLVFAATGVGPFGDDTPLAVMRRIRTEEPDLGGLAEPVRPLAARCLARDPGDRPTADALAAALDPLPPLPRHGWLPPAVTALVPALPAELRPVAPSPPPTRVDPDPPPPTPPRTTTSRRTVLIGSGLLGLATLGSGGLTWLATARPAPRPAGEPYVRWTFGAGGIVRGLALGEGVLYATGEDALVHALDQQTGQPRWSYPLRKPMGGPAVLDGRTVAVTNGQALLGLDAASGTPLWETAGMVQFGGGGGIVLGASATGDGVTLHGLDPQTGVVRWETGLPRSYSRIPWRLAFGFGRLVVAADRTVVAHDAPTGRVLWRYTTTADVEDVGGDAQSVFHLTAEELVVVEAAAGGHRWRRPVDPEADGTVDAVAVSDGTIFLCGGRRFEARDLATGEERWGTLRGSMGRALPAVVTTPLGATGDTCYVGGTNVVLDDRQDLVDEFRVTAVDARSGTVLWNLRTDPTPPPGDVPLVAVPGTVFVGGTASVHAVSER